MQGRFSINIFLRLTTTFEFTQKYCIMPFNMEFLFQKLNFLIFVAVEI